MATILPQTTDADSKAAILSSLILDKTFDEGATGSLENMLILFSHANELRKREPSVVHEFREIFADERAARDHMLKCSECQKTIKEFIQGFKLGL